MRQAKRINADSTESHVAACSDTGMILLSKMPAMYVKTMPTNGERGSILTNYKPFGDRLSAG